MIGKARVLVVEDDPMSLLLAREILRHFGHEVIEATTIAEGRARLRGAPPDVVVTDAALADGRGEDLLNEIRADPSLARLPVLVVTAAAMAGDRERFLAAGFDRYMSKPIGVVALGDAVKALLER